MDVTTRRGGLTIDGKRLRVCEVRHGLRLCPALPIDAGYFARSTKVQARQLTLHVSSDLDDAEIERLLMHFRTIGIVAPLDSRGDITTLGYIIELAKAGAPYATAIGSLAALATQLIKWRESRRQTTAKTPVRLLRHDSPPLDLNVATDDEVRAWLSTLN